MSFSDMMSSGRGPGVIGMVMALIVLIGFGILFVFAFDDGLQGGKRTIESVLAEQLRQINTHTDLIKSGTVRLEEAAARGVVAAELKQVKRQLLDIGNRLAVLQTELESEQSALEADGEAFARYQDDYRNHVRALAKGREMDELRTSDGTVYRDVVIREVTPIGIQIRHQDGQKRISFENLPADMVDHFQFDDAQKAAAVQEELMAHKNHEEAVAAADQAAAARRGEQDKLNAIAGRERKVREIALKERQVSMLEREVGELESDIRRAKADAIAAKAAGRTRITSTSPIEQKIAAKRTQIAALRAAIVRLKASL